MSKMFECQPLKYLPFGEKIWIEQDGDKLFALTNNRNKLYTLTPDEINERIAQHNKAVTEMTTLRRILVGDLVLPASRVVSRDAPVKVKKRLGRPPTTGRYDSVPELTAGVLQDYHGSPASRTVAMVAKSARVSQGVVNRILNDHAKAKKVSV
jgi:hypothetical protein